ncbi:serine hydrolase domain-containing protein [Kitasatospora sp. NPDC047058]|uniref:serine hydrolase domain-containing protein n=1 Tax=Kitasatospora sp. NPDC047058 TaxID=3155620 RepID=UPI0033DBDB7B
MRRTSLSRLLAASLCVASVLAPVTVLPATVHAASATVHAASAAGRDCPQGGLGPELTARLDSTIEDVRQQAGIPGVVVGLWMPGKGCYVRATGVGDTATNAPMPVDTYLRIGSETKTFTVTALLELVDDGLVGLDDPVSAYLDGVPCGDRISLRQLAEMRSGLFPYTSDPDFIHDLEADPHRSFTPQEVLAYGFRHDNTAGPGEVFEYSNTNLVLLGLVVEKVGGRRLDEFIRDRVLRPAHLRHTLLPTGAEFPEPHAHGYTVETLSGAVADATDWNPSWAWAAGAMISNLHDLRRWAEVVATGRLLSPRTQAERLRTLPTGFPGTSYGLGILETNGWIGHNGSLPGYETVTVYLPSQQATLVLLLNTDILHEGQEPSTLVARAVTALVTPDNVYAGAIPPR